MTGDQISGDEAGLRRRLLFQSRHRGVKELDLILGRFAEAHLAGFGMAELQQFAVLLGEPDPDIYDWLVGRVPLPTRLQNPLMQRLLDFTNREKTSL
ncbi:succinate dehydrogenase assembly factor 2 [Dongia sedimenti]|uniref:FAD assembly factor SdhE n=1 Tax=Dongia sedimenti TaxID=3064282 RepID=A0ABU0YJU2_9PROT|nr:succinate dehydrogenase assembly factor 2 [Rhodospirillaceae bacterium R-7]